MCATDDLQARVDRIERDNRRMRVVVAVVFVAALALAGFGASPQVGVFKSLTTRELEIVDSHGERIACLGDVDGDGVGRLTLSGGKGKGEVRMIGGKVPTITLASSAEWPRVEIGADKSGATLSLETEETDHVSGVLIGADDETGSYALLGRPKSKQTLGMVIDRKKNASITIMGDGSTPLWGVWRQGDMTRMDFGDAKGKTRVSMGLGTDSPYFSIMGSDGEPQCDMYIDEDDLPVLALLGEQDHKDIGRTRVFLGVTDKDEGIAGVYASDGNGSALAPSDDSESASAE